MQLRNTLPSNFNTYIFIHISIYRHPHTRTRTQHSGANKHSVTDDDTTREIFARHAAPMTASQKLNSCIFNSTANAWKFRKIQKQNKKKTSDFTLVSLSLSRSLGKFRKMKLKIFGRQNIFSTHTHSHTADSLALHSHSRLTLWQVQHSSMKLELWIDIVCDICIYIYGTHHSTRSGCPSSRQSTFDLPLSLSYHC